MSSNLDRYKEELGELIKLGSRMEGDLYYQHLTETGALKKKQAEKHKEISDTFAKEYQRFYTEAHAVIRQMAPARIDEFENLYKSDPRRKSIDQLTFSIQDWLNGIRPTVDPRTGKKYFQDLMVVMTRFSTQLQILKAVTSSFESSLFDIRQIVQADLFDTELASAEELTKKGFLRGAGAIAGVVLEKHLAQVADNHNVITRKKNPSISDFNDLLKQSSVVDVPVWRQIQRLADIRNLCDHNKAREPTKDEVTELVSGVEKITKTLF